MAICDDLLSHEKSKLARLSLNGTVLDYLDKSDAGVDHKDSARDFVQSIQDFVYDKAKILAAARQKRGIPKGLTEQELANWSSSESQLQSKWHPAPVANC